MENNAIKHTSYSEDKKYKIKYFSDDIQEDGDTYIFIFQVDETKEEEDTIYLLLTLKENNEIKDLNYFINCLKEKGDIDIVYIPDDLQGMLLNSLLEIKKDFEKIYSPNTHKKFLNLISIISENGNKLFGDYDYKDDYCGCIEDKYDMLSALEELHDEMKKYYNLK